MNQYGGAERVIEAVHALYPGAPLFTTIHNPAALPPHWQDWDIRPSWLNRLPFVNQRHQYFLPLYPWAVESLDLRGFDTILSLTSAFAHGVNPDPTARHLCYCLTPARFLWNWRDYVENERVSRPLRLLLPLLVLPLRQWDRLAAERVDEFIGISRAVQERIRKYYRRPSALLYPPVDVDRFSISSRAPGDYYYIQSRLVPYKRIDLAVEAFNRLRLPLVIAGAGRDRARLERLAGPTVRFIGRVSDAEAREWMAHCRAFIFPGEEDFGLTPLEANASGRPVIAFAGGGALDTIVPGLNGELFCTPAAEALAETVAAFDPARYHPTLLRQHAELFGRPVFQRQLRNYIEGAPLPAPAPAWSRTA